MGMTKLKTRIARYLLKVTPAQVEEKCRFGNYIEEVTNGIPWERRDTRGRIGKTSKTVPSTARPQYWFERYL